MPRRRLQDRIEDLVTKAIATDDPHELDAVNASTSTLNDSGNWRLTSSGRRQTHWALLEGT